MGNKSEGNKTRDNITPDQDDTQIETPKIDFKIKIGALKRIDETIENLSNPHRVAFFKSLVVYVNTNMETYSKSATQKTPGLFDKPRESKADRELKFKLINRFNVEQDSFKNGKFYMDFDLGIACDLMLDLLRYEEQDVMNPSLAVQDFIQAQNKNEMYMDKDFFKHIKQAELRLFVSQILNCAVRARELKLYKSHSAVAL